MRILVFNHQDISGGSAIAAYRLCKGIEKLYKDVEIYFVVGNKQSQDPRVFCTKKNLKQQYIERIVDRYTNKYGLQYVWYPFSSKAILTYAKSFAPDLFYLRNIHGGYFDTSLIPKLSKMAPIVWTLSDMWSFTGHCAHSFGDTSWKEMKSGCPDKSIYPAIGLDTGKWLLKRKKGIYASADLTIITPSKWLYALAKQSPVFTNKEIVQIYNGFDLNTFRPKDQKFCRAAIDVPVDAKVLMFSASFFKNNPWKGGNDLLNIMRTINERTRSRVHILIVGNGDFAELSEFSNLVVHNTGYIQNDTLMATFLSAADVYIYPSRADNLPNTLLEAISCGTPGVTFNIGGCGEIIEDGFSGYVVKPFDTDRFAMRVMDILESDVKLKQFSENARQAAENKFTLEKMCTNYYELFRKIVKSPNRSA